MSKILSAFLIENLAFCQKSFCFMNNSNNHINGSKPETPLTDAAGSFFPVNPSIIACSPKTQFAAKANDYLERGKNELF